MIRTTLSPYQLFFFFFLFFKVRPRFLPLGCTQASNRMVNILAGTFVRCPVSHELRIRLLDQCNVVQCCFVAWVESESPLGHGQRLEHLLGTLFLLGQTVLRLGHRQNNVLVLVVEKLFGHTRVLESNEGTGNGMDGSVTIKAAIYSNP